MRVDIMLVANISKEPYLTLWYEHCDAESMYRCIANPFVVEAAGFVEPIKIRFVTLTAPEIERADFEIGKKIGSCCIRPRFVNQRARKRRLRGCIS